MDVSSMINISSEYLKDVLKNTASHQEVKDKSFDSILKSAVDLLEETNYLQNQAEEAEIQFALGYSTNTHDLQMAQEKANIALQYTVAVRDRVIEAYKEIMNIQI